MLVLAVFLLGTAILYGIRSGMDVVFPTPLDTRVQQIGAAISDVAYGLDLKYAAHGRVVQTLLKGGMSEVPENYQPLGLKEPHYRDPVAWNRLIEKAAHLEDITRNVSISDRTLAFVQTEDLGLVDFYKLSFRLFGLNIEGFFRTYFLFVGMSVLLLFATFWLRPGILIAANALLFGLFVSICYAADAASGIFTVSNGRFLSTLAILPAFHLAALIWAPPRKSTPVILTAVAQTFLLGFAVGARSSAAWAVVMLAASILLLVIFKARSYWSTQPMKAFAANALTWPMVVLLLGLASLNIYQRAHTHPAYFALDETLPHHYFWHSLAYGLGFGELERVLPELRGVRGDEVGTYLGNAYLDRIMGFKTPSVSAYYGSNLFPELGRPRSYERVVRAAYLDFALSNPGYMLHLTLITKPRLMARIYFDAFRRVVTRSPGYLAIAGVAFLGLLLLVARTPSTVTDLRFGLIVIAGLLAASFLPPLVAYPTVLAAGDAFALGIALIAAIGLSVFWRDLQRATQRLSFARGK